MAENVTGPDKAEGYGDPTKARPYRSHKIPACDFCHRRKSRCIRTRQDGPCALCRKHQRECLTSPSGRDGPKRPAAAARTVRSSVPPSRASTVSATGVIDRASADEPIIQDVAFAPDGVEPQSPDSPMQRPTDKRAGHIVGPNLARDAQLLEQYLSPQDGAAVSHVRPNPYSVYSNDPRDPVVYMKVPRQRSTSTIGSGKPGFKQYDIIANVLGPSKNALFDLYFDIIHPAFPILDQVGVTKAYHEGTLPCALTCEIYAVSLISWHLSPTIAASNRAAPDVHYIWNVAVSAMHKDFLSPTFSTILACILDILGRPITSLTYNAVNIGSTVALAQSLGLNRNPSKWNLDPRQKNLRVKAWWGLLIHDYWASLCHGTPSHIHGNQWDVALPEIDTLLNPVSHDSPAATGRLREGAESFIRLCQLTKILGQVLPLIYALRGDSFGITMKRIRQLQTLIDDWETSLPEWLNAESATFQRDAPGALNLWLSFLALKICMCRVSLRETRNGDCDVEEIQYYQSRCRKAAAALIDFVTSLGKDETQVFWLPYAAYHFASAATLMMRCALETQSSDLARNCVEKAKSLTDYLRKMKTDMDWDLANICLGQCETTVKQMSEHGSLTTKRHTVTHTHGPGTAHFRDLQSTGDAEETRSDLHGNVFGSVDDECNKSGSTPLYEVAPGGINTSTGSVTDLNDLLNQIPEDFYFPELWQDLYFEPPPCP